MNKDNLKKLMLKNKTFLRQLYSSASIKTKKAILLRSNLEQVDTLLNILFYITQGDIPIKKSSYDVLDKHSILEVLHTTFLSLHKLNTLLENSLKQKTVFLLKFIKFYKYLLQSLFVKKK